MFCMMRSGIPALNRAVVPVDLMQQGLSKPVDDDVGDVNQHGHKVTCGLMFSGSVEKDHILRSSVLAPSTDESALAFTSECSREVHGLAMKETY